MALCILGNQPISDYQNTDCLSGLAMEEWRGCLGGTRLPTWSITCPFPLRYLFCFGGDLFSPVPPNTHSSSIFNLRQEMTSGLFFLKSGDLRAKFFPAHEMDLTREVGEWESGLKSGAQGWPREGDIHLEGQARWLVCWGRGAAMMRGSSGTGPSKCGVGREAGWSFQLRSGVRKCRPAGERRCSGGRAEPSRPLASLAVIEALNFTGSGMQQG